MNNIEKLYGKKNQRYVNRKEKISDIFFSTFKEYPSKFYSSPGRMEIIGNHTDHNNGLVLVGAINLDIFTAVKIRNDNLIILKSEGFPKMEIDLNDLEIKENEFGRSESIIRGVAYKFKTEGYKIGGFEAVCESNIFKGAGLSSSAAFELLIAEILNDIYNNDEISRVEMAKIGQFAENVYFNKPSGLLDQMGVALGGINYIDFKDTKKPIVENCALDVPGYKIVLINTGGSHSGLTKYYASIKDDMKAIASFFNKDVLREVDENEFYNNLHELRSKFGGRAILRAIHYFDENKRVFKAIEALKNEDTETFLKMVNESGQSSYKLLQNCHYDKDTKQGIALAYELCNKYLDGGAYRVHGGGFRGTVIAFVKEKDQIPFINKMKQVFGERQVCKLNIRMLGSSRIIED